MLVKVFGPNLKDQSQGQFHVHSADCVDCRRYGPRGPKGGEAGIPVFEAASRLAVAEDVYQDIIAESDSPASAYLDDFHFAPCCDSLE